MKNAADLPIATACPLGGELPGEGASRHCVSCNTQVVDLSMLTAEDADALMRSASRPRCVSYLVDEHGAVIHAVLPALPPVRSLPTLARRRLPLVAGALFLAACNGSGPASDSAASGAASAPDATVTAAGSSAPPAMARGEIEAPVTPTPHPAPNNEGCGVENKPAAGAASAQSPKAFEGGNEAPATSPPPRPGMKRGKPVRKDYTF